MIKIGQKYKSVKTGCVLEIKEIIEKRNRLMVTSRGFDDYLECIQVMDRFTAGIGVSFIQVLAKNQSGYESLDMPSEHPGVLRVYKVASGVGGGVYRRQAQDVRHRQSRCRLD